MYTGILEEQTVVMNEIQYNVLKKYPLNPSNPSDFFYALIQVISDKRLFVARSMASYESRRNFKYSTKIRGNSDEEFWILIHEVPSIKNADLVVKNLKKKFVSGN